MLVYSSEIALKAHLDKVSGSSIGFVPTMGALHEGHLQLVARAKQENDLVVVSIFVNPTQFNNKNDLQRYPRNLEKDLEMLRSYCDVVFAPTEEEIYPPGYREPDVDLGMLETVMEGKFRPGHFKGVVMVVKRLFEIVRPDRAYFGLKDYQQVAVIRHMNAQLELVPEIIACPTAREGSGLAMSSRNELLSKEERKDAEILFRTLTEVREKAKKGESPEKLKEWASQHIENNSGLKPEYFEIVDERDLSAVKAFEDNKKAVACVAAWAGKVRLIDNLLIFP
jgi:pantoate--beta-alanine ligase